LIDVEEQPIERAKYGQENRIQAKKHTKKYQTVVNAETKEILDVYNDCGKVHDFRRR